MEDPASRIEIYADDFPDVYRDLGIDVRRLGCIMLVTDPLVVSDVIAEQDLHHFDPVTDPYDRPIASEPAAHVSLLYGLLRSGPEMRKHVDAVLAGWQPEDLPIESVGSWPGQETRSDFVSIHARVPVTDNLAEAHARLSLLPHMDIYGPMRPHVTMAHVKVESDWRGYIAQLNARFAGTTVAAGEISYGD
jgi:hypothetical protein